MDMLYIYVNLMYEAAATIAQKIGFLVRVSPFVPKNLGGRNILLLQPEICTVPANFL